jgi:hypothetical protein
MGPNRFPSLFPYTLHTNELLGSLATALPDFGINAIYDLCSCFIIVNGFFIVHDKLFS